MCPYMPYVVEFYSSGFLYSSLTKVRCPSLNKLLVLKFINSPLGTFNNFI